MAIDMKKVVQFGLVILLSGWLLFFILQKIDLTTSDLGRHLKNAEIFLQTKEIFQTNFYSYTNPDFPSPNHHWGGGLLFYFFWKIGGFSALSLLYAGLMVAAFLFMFTVARREAGMKIAFISSLIAIPLIAERAEVRPEGFSYFFTALFFWILWSYRAGTLKKHWLFTLPILMIFWVNIHIYFFLGLALIALFFAYEFISQRRSAELKTTALLFGGSFIASFINPAGIAGALYPFFIFQNYGYPIVENQTIWFLMGRIANPNLWYVIAVTALFAVTFALLAIRKKWNPRAWLYLFLGTGATIFGFLALRNLTLFGFFMVPTLSYGLRGIISKKMLARPTVFLFGSLAILALILNTHRAALPWERGIFGTGLLAGNNELAQFMKREKIKGPIFNNYDIGGYLIYHLYPNMRVFVDNRPESYPEEFFTREYIPMQENERDWQAALKRYSFNAIVFSHRDLTPWAQQFLIARIQDSEWAPVFIDSYGIVFLRRAPDNQSLIRRLEISKDRFIMPSEVRAPVKL